MASLSWRSRAYRCFSERRPGQPNFIEKFVKSKLLCCESNQRSPNAQWECSYCECVFENADHRDAHNREIHPEQLAAKQKMKCCDSRKSKRQALDHHQCRYCDCVFLNKAGCDYHMKQFHQCKCGVIMLTDDVRIEHKILHEEEAHLEQLQDEREAQLEKMEIQRECQMDHDFALIYVKANKLNEFRPRLNYEPDFYYILSHHRFKNDELVRFVKKFKKEFLKFIALDCNHFKSAAIIYLAENDALSIEDIASFLGEELIRLSNGSVVAFVSYLLDKGHTIKSEWVARVIGEDELIRRIKQKHTFTFNEIHEAREKSQDAYRLMFGSKKFRTQLQKHFPDRSFDEKSDSTSQSDM